MQLLKIVARATQRGALLFEQGADFTETKQRRELPATILRSCAYWACVQTLNFRLLPPQYATVCTMCASVVWSTYLAMVAHRS